MTDNLGTLRQGYDAFAKGDIDGVMDIFDESIRWEGPNATELPGGGTHEGKEAVMQMIGSIQASFDRFDLTPDDFLESGDRVVVLWHVDGRTKTGNDVSLPGVHVWDLRDGKAVRCQALTDTFEFAKAQGIAQAG
jgi:ketosteroid isomerase-like protein